MKPVQSTWVPRLSRADGNKLRIVCNSLPSRWCQLYSADNRESKQSKKMIMTQTVHGYVYRKSSASFFASHIVPLEAY